ncbi:hypothetical protein NY78_0862 [Desulfovibrio sp. TomC]|nr:hypothetical protein NY78_0862 [Desulfovibrio sp. TomC]
MHKTQLVHQHALHLLVRHRFHGDSFVPVGCPARPEHRPGLAQDTIGRFLPALRQLLWPEVEEGLACCQGTDGRQNKRNIAPLRSRLKRSFVTLQL